MLPTLLTRCITTVIPFALAAALLSPIAAFAQLPLGAIVVTFSDTEVESSFAVSFELTDGNRVQGVVLPLEPDTRITGTHSSVRAMAGGLIARFDTRFQQPTATGLLPDLSGLTIETWAAAPTGGSGGGHDDDDFDIILFDIVGVANNLNIISFEILGVANTPNVVELRFVPKTETEQLSGYPPYLFNAPEPGGTLVALLPVPSAAGSDVPDLFVSGNEGTRVSIYEGVDMSGLWPFLKNQ